MPARLLLAMALGIAAIGLAARAHGELPAELPVVELSGDQRITGYTEWHDAHYKISGNVYFDSGGTLHAQNAIIELMCTYNRQFRYYWNGGTLETNNVVIGGTKTDGVVYSCNFQVDSGLWNSVDTEVRYTSGQINAGGASSFGRTIGLRHNAGEHPDSVIMNGYGDVTLTDSNYPLSLTVNANGGAAVGDFSFPLDTPLTQVYDSTNMPGARWRLALNNVTVPLWWLFVMSMSMDGPPTELILRDCPKVITNIGGTNLTGSVQLPAGPLPPGWSTTVANVTFRTADKEALVPTWGVYLTGAQTDLELRGPTNICEYFLWAGKSAIVGTPNTYDAIVPLTTTEAGLNSSGSAEMMIRNALVGTAPSRPTVRGQLTARGTSTVVIRDSLIQNATFITEDTATITLDNCVLMGDIRTNASGGPITFEPDCHEPNPLHPGILAGDDFDSGLFVNLLGRWTEWPALAVWPEEREYAFGGSAQNFPIVDGVLQLRYSDYYDTAPLEGRLVHDARNAPLDLSGAPLYFVLRYRARIAQADADGNMLISTRATLPDYGNGNEKRRRLWVPANTPGFVQVIVNVNDPDDPDENLYPGRVAFGAANGAWLPWSEGSTYVAVHLGEPEGGQRIAPGDTIELDQCFFTRDYAPFLRGAGRIVPSSDDAVAEDMLLRLTAPGGSGYSWTRNGVPLTDEPSRVLGAGEQTLTLDPVQMTDSGYYICSYEDGTGLPVSTAPFWLEVAPYFELPGAGVQGLALTMAALSLMGAWSYRRRHG